MNTPRVWSFPRVRVAALMLFSVVLVAGCSSATTTAGTPSPTPAQNNIVVAEFVQTTPMTPGSDLVDVLSSGEKLPGMDIAATALGVDSIVAPKDQYLSKGYLGVGALGAKCVLVMVGTPGDTDPNQLAVIITHRLDSDPGKMVGVGSIDQLAPYVKTILESSLCTETV